MRSVGDTWAVLLPLAVVALDQVSKVVVASRAAIAIGSFATIQLVVNPHAGFSLAIPSLTLNAIWLTLIGYVFFQVRQPLLKLSLLLVIGGGLSNFIDRLVMGGVRDIVSVGDVFFNLADGAIVAGVVAACVLLIIQHWQASVR